MTTDTTTSMCVGSGAEPENGGRVITTVNTRLPGALEHRAWCSGCHSWAPIDTRPIVATFAPHRHGIEVTW